MASTHESAQHDVVADGMKKHSILDSNKPFLVPYAKELTVSDREFAQYIATLKPAKVYSPVEKTAPTNQDEVPKSRLVDGLMGNSAMNHDEHSLATEGKTLTENADVAFASAGTPLVNAFYEIKSSARNIEKLLNEAWAEDADATLKIIFNARSIHLGKGDKPAAYNCLGWLYEYHPQTLLANLVWLARPLIEKKSKKSESDKSKDSKQGESETKDAAVSKQSSEDVDDDFEMIDEPIPQTKQTATDAETISMVLPAGDAPVGANTRKHDVKYGVAHGYWKDLANILLLAVHGELKADGNVSKVLNVDTRSTKGSRRVWDAAEAKGKRQEKAKDLYEKFTKKFSGDSAKQSVESNTFRALHLTVARLFASQLLQDGNALTSGQGKKAISFAAKWCPSPFESHDKQTFIVSSIAEILLPCEKVDAGLANTPENRQDYLKRARLTFRQSYLSPLRKHLVIVERNVTTGTFSEIKYERVPSLAMERHAPTFLRKDETAFVSYLEKVATGKSRISGAVLLPSTLVAKVSETINPYNFARPNKPQNKVQALANQRIVDGQWKTLVQRIKDSGTLESAIAVCDVSGSMMSPQFADRTTPMHSAIGLSLLLAEIVAPPFGGMFISFSETPAVHKVGGANDKRSFAEKVDYIMRSDWGMSTNFESVFDLLLDIALKQPIGQDEMVKKVFVFSDMQFNQASAVEERWTTSFERVKARFEKFGYKLPELVFWNLAHGTHGAPVDAEEENVSLVSGYSQAMLKMFLDGGEFEDVVEQTIEDQDESDEEGLVGVRVKEKLRKDPMAAVKKAISHPAYAMLMVVD